MEQPTSSSTATINNTLAAAAAVSPNSSSAAAASVSVSDTTLSLRACNTQGCKVNKYVEMTKRKCSQFVSSPYIMHKPLLVNGKTSIFQIGGEMAKMADIPTLPGSTVGDNAPPIYRIKPGTHAHVINYVLIDEGSESMEKAKSCDQAAMRMLLDSQRDSAQAKLQKLVSTHRGITNRNDKRKSGTVSPRAPPVSITHVTTPQIHPDFSIASVEGAVPFVPPTIGAPSQNVPAQIRTALDTSPSTSSSITNIAVVDHLQAELAELRRKVAEMEGGSKR